MITADKITGLIFLSILVIIAIYFITSDYFTYKRLNKAADKLIGEPDMSSKDKSTNLEWLSNNCMRFSHRSILFRRKYDNIVIKIQSFLLNE